VDRTPNENGFITEEVEALLRIGSHEERTRLAITNLGWQSVIIGHSWLMHHNPEVDWANQKVTFSRCPPQCKKPTAPNTASDEEDLQPGDAIYATFISEEWATAQIRATTTPSQQLAEQAHAGDDKRTFAEMVPEAYHDFDDVFSKDAFNTLPPRKPWDHAIDLIPGADLPRSRTFPLSPAEQRELDEFLRENLANGRIQPSKSPVGAPVFFVKKKDGSLRLVQDYRKLNMVTVKNSYPLPLISDVLSRLRNAQWFTGLDLRWGFNNVRIQEGDEWKAAFATNRGLYEPQVMFFGLCNSPATFQTMMNDILRDFISHGVAICYMDDILIYTETLTEHCRVT